MDGSLCGEARCTELSDLFIDLSSTLCLGQKEKAEETYKIFKFYSRQMKDACTQEFL